MKKKKEASSVFLLNANRKQLQVKISQNFKRKIKLRLVNYECIQVRSCKRNVNVKHYSVRGEKWEFGCLWISLMEVEAPNRIVISIPVIDNKVSLIISNTGVK